MPTQAASVRPIHEVVADIYKDIRTQGVKIPYGAVPYLEAMTSLSSINDSYGADSAKMIISYGLGNLQTYRGPKAKELKAELKKIAGIK